MSSQESASTLADAEHASEHVPEHQNAVIQHPPTTSTSHPNNTTREETNSPFGQLRSVKSYNEGYGFTRTGSDNGDRQATDVETGRDPEKAFEVDWDGEDDPMNPRSMRRARKWTIVIIVSMSSLCVTCTSSLYTSTYGQITEEFNCSQIVATLGLSLFVAGLGIGPMLLGPLSEVFMNGMCLCEFVADTASSMVGGQCTLSPLVSL